MITPRRNLRRDDPDLRARFDAIRTEFEVPGPFSSAALAAATEAADAWRARSSADRLAGRIDRRDIPFVTIDPEGSRDLDQAFHAERGAAGHPEVAYVVHYAIADVAAFVPEGGPVDVEARARGATIYLPDRRAPLYPEAIGEGVASLLPDDDRPALLWRIELDDTGRRIGTTLQRALVRSRAARSYVDVQHDLDHGNAEEPLRLLAEIGPRRVQREIARGGVSIELSEQEVRSGTDGFELVAAAPLPVERWNAQISLLTGIAAAAIMVHGGVGLLRTMPAPPQFALDGLRHAARILGVPWPKQAQVNDVIRSVDPASDRGAAFLTAALRLMRGAGYQVLAPDTPAATQAAVGAPYAHVTAPLRRYADRFANEVVLSLAAGTTPPPEITAPLADLPGIMESAARRDHAVDRAVVDLFEAELLQPRLGATFRGSVIEVRADGRAVVQIEDPPVVTVVDADHHELGSAVRLRLDAADPTTRTVHFTVLG